MELKIANHADRSSDALVLGLVSYGFLLMATVDYFMAMIDGPHLCRPATP